MIDPTSRNIADSDNDLLESLEDRLLQEMAEFLEPTGHVPHGVPVQSDGDEIGGRIGICESDCPGQHHPCVQRANLSFANFVQQDSAAGHTGHVDPDCSGTNEVNAVTDIPDHEQVITPGAFRIEHSCVFQKFVA